MALLPAEPRLCCWGKRKQGNSSSCRWTDFHLPSTAVIQLTTCIQHLSVHPTTFSPKRECSEGQDQTLPLEPASHQTTQTGIPLPWGRSALITHSALPAPTASFPYRYTLFCRCWGWHISTRRSGGTALIHLLMAEWHTHNSHDPYPMLYPRPSVAIASTKWIPNV